MSIFSNLLETLGELMRPLWSDLIRVLPLGLQDPQSGKVRADAMRYVQPHQPHLLFACVCVVAYSLVCMVSVVYVLCLLLFVYLLRQMRWCYA